MRLLGISAGGQHTCAVTSDGAALCWEDNSCGKLGDGTTTDRNTPLRVLSLESGVASISMGNSHTCAFTTAGAFQCWRSNDHGQVG
ncbi:MAG: hypothetical protein WCZ18_08970 [Ottowia sp.]